MTILSRQFTKYGFALVLLIIFGLTLRLVNLNNGLWIDEILSLVYFARLPFSEIVSTYTNSNQHTFYSVLAHFSIGMFGEHPWSLRLPSLVFGVLSIPVIYYLGKLVTTNKEAILATILLTVSYHHIWFSQNARAYTMLLFWTLVVAYLFIRNMENRSFASWLGYAVAIALGMYSHLTMAFVLSSHILIYLWYCLENFNKDNNQRVHWKGAPFGFLLSILFSIFLYLPILSQMIHFYLQKKQTVLSHVSSPFWAIIEALRGIQDGLGIGMVGLLLCIIIFVSGLLSYAKENRVVIALFLLPAVITCVATVVLHRPIFPRFFFYMMGFALLITVRGAMNTGKYLEKAIVIKSLRKVIRNGLGVFLIILLIFFSIFPLKHLYSFPKQDYIGAMNFVNTHRMDYESVLTVGSCIFTPYHRYYNKDWQHIKNMEQLENILAKGSRVWLIYTFPIYLKTGDPDLMAFINKNFTTVKVFRGTVRGGDVYVTRNKPF